MKNPMGKTALLAVALSSVFALAACDVEKTDEGNVDLPNYDVETAEVDVDAEPVPVTVPDVDVDVETPDEPNTEVMDEEDSAADDEAGDGM